jgi:L-lactate dehydrogenase complex protein LldF
MYQMRSLFKCLSYIYKNVGGYTYNTTYQGPIGTVISPHLGNFQEHIHLSTACSLCAGCTEVCPVKIPLHELIHENRKRAVSQTFPTYRAIRNEGV